MTSIAMTKEEREAFLAEIHVGIISVPETGRGPLTVPLWYMYEPGGEVVVLTPPDSRKGKLVDVGTRISLCVQSEVLPYKYCSVEGPVVSVEQAEVERDAIPLASRYLGAETGRAYIEGTRTDGTTKEVVIRMQPERWYAGDFAKRFADT